MRIIVFLFCFVLMLSCSDKPSPEVSFYYWKTSFKLTSLEKATIKNNEVKKIYLRYFDVALLDNEPFPVSPVAVNENLKNIEIIPVVFFKNEVFLSKKINIEQLSQNVSKLISQINKKNKIEIKEVQLDCDWSLESQEKYFHFITNFKRISKLKISATIRLHQIKYFEKTKIPDVDKGVLMFYNMGKISAGETNSIYDKKIAESYIKSLQKYPLKLNVAFPIFSWAIHIRNNKVINLISKTNSSNFTSDKNFINYKDNFFKVQENQLKMGFFFQKGDIIKIESISKDNLSEMIEQVDNNIKTAPEEIIYYDLDEFNIKQYNDESFFKKCNSWF
jgi:hypothetical protein